MPWISRTAKKNGASTVIASDLAQLRRDIAKKAGADIVINPSEEDPVELVREETSGYGADVVIEAVGIPQTWEQAVEMTRDAGTTVLLSLIVSLFVIGLLVMIFALMGGALQDATTDTTAITVINDTTVAISSSTDFFDLFIVIGSMVVLVLLTVIIIVAIRNSGLMQQG